MVELLKSKSMIVVMVLVLGVSFISSSNEARLTNSENNQNEIHVNA